MRNEMRLKFLPADSMILYTCTCTVMCNIYMRIRDIHIEYINMECESLGSSVGCSRMQGMLDELKSHTSYYNTNTYTLYYKYNVYTMSSH